MQSVASCDIGPPCVTLPVGREHIIAIALKRSCEARLCEHTFAESEDAKQILGSLFGTAYPQ
jgi:hypothetical protein